MAVSANKHRAGVVANTAKELRPLIKSALRSGWTLERGRKGGHAILVAPDGHREPIPTACRARGLTVTFRRTLIAHGLDVEA